MGELLTLWSVLGLLAHGAFCLSVVFRGITQEATLELRIAWYTGRGLLAIASIALLLVLSRGLILLSQWVIR